MDEGEKKFLSLKEAVVIKYGVIDTRVDKHGYTQPAGKAKTIMCSPQLQPWFGFAYKDGRSLTWPREDVDRWAAVFNHNRAVYAENLLHDEREEVRQGVLQQLKYLSARGRLPEDVVAVLETVA